MTIIIPVFIVALIMYSVKNIQNLNTRKDRLKKIPVSKQILYIFLCFSPCLIFFVMMMIIAMILR